MTEETRRILKAIASPLRSRKVRTAIATVIVAHLYARGIAISEMEIAAILGVGVAIILGIAHEDHGTKSNASK